MSDSLERWGEQAPEVFEPAARAFRADGPDEQALARMIARAELSSPAARSGLTPVVAKMALTVLAVVSFSLAVWWFGSSDAPPVRPLPHASAPVKAAQDLVRAPEPVAPPSLPSPSAEELSPPSAKPRKTPLAKQTTAAKKGSIDTLGELALLARARRVLRADAARAYALTEEHLMRYPNGALSEERELLAIEALVMEGRDVQAARRAESFRRDYPRSVHAPRLTALLQNQPDPAR